MAKTIAIQLEIDGAQQAVKTIGELETAIEQFGEIQLFNYPCMVVLSDPCL